MPAPAAAPANSARCANLDNPSLVGPPCAVTIAEPLALACGRSLSQFVVSFETYGSLSPRRDNAVLVCHSLTKGAHAAGRHTAADARPGWWDAAIGPGKMLDTNRYFVISPAALAAGDSTGPASPDPQTGRPYGVSFPVITVSDMVDAQRRLIEHLGIRSLCAVVGGCLGGQQAIEWAIRHPALVQNAIVITTTPRTSTHTIAIFAVMRHLIQADPAWNGGDYYGRTFPGEGLGGAVAAAVPLWMSPAAMETRFGRRTLSGNSLSYTLDPEFEVEQFIGRLAKGARHNLDPNAFMYLMRAVEYFDLAREYGSLNEAVARITARVLFVSYRGDWRYPAAETEHMHRALCATGGYSRHVVLDSPLGHGAFLYDVPGLARECTPFLAADQVFREPVLQPFS